jgi:glucose-6-phosphate 1-dehydrogenase
VPFFVRTGKCLPLTATEVLVELKRPPYDVFREGKRGGTNYLRFRLAPDMSISLGARAKQPGEQLVGEEAELYAGHESGSERPPYQRLIGDAAEGDQLLFAREDTVEAAWRIVDPILDLPQAPLRYRRGTWGPKAALGLLPAGEQWHAPVRAANAPVGRTPSRPRCSPPRLR